LLNPGGMLGDRYRVDALLAKGGMGSVYLVKDERLNNKELVAKEIILPGQNVEFVDEAQILTSLSHPFIPKITDYFKPDSNGCCYLVMEYVNGVTLQKKFEDHARTLPLQTILTYMLQLSEVLIYLHQRQNPIVFRDLKPSNIMLDEYDNIRLIDFGIARKFEQGKAADTLQMGTIAFAAPEQFENKQTDPRTDIYSMGAILYYLLTQGSYYFQSTGAVHQTLAHLPAQLVHMLARMLERNPGDRYQSVQEVREQLKQLSHNPEPEVQAEAAYLEKTVVLTQAQTASASMLRTTVLNTPIALPYTTQASQSNPALIIYLLDVSGSMSIMDGERRRLDVVMDSLHVALKQMVFRSTKGSRISPRYRVAIIAYSDEAQDLLGGIRKIDEVMNTGKLPVLTPQRFTDTAKAFLHAERLLQVELPFIQDCPAPLVCHMTDGVYTGEDPLPIVQRIKEMSVKDGHVLVENIFISDDVLEKKIDQPKRWPGIRADTPFRDEYGSKLRMMSSVTPESYRQMMLEANYSLAEDSLLMFPGTNPDLVSLGFQMSAATPIQ
jgi:serine/threonine protein kinase